jgi:hypothetical protein
MNILRKEASDGKVFQQGEILLKLKIFIAVY